MAVTDRRIESDDVLSGAASAVVPRGFRPASRRRARIAAGVALAAVAVAGNAVIYTSLDDTTEVLQVVHDVRAGEVVTAGDLRIVEVDLDPTVPAVPASEIARVVNQYARVHIVSGSLISDVLVQPTPLVGQGQGVVAVEIRPTRVPSGLRERSRVMIIVVPDDAADAPFVTEGRVVARSQQEAGAGDVLALSVEVRQEDAAAVAAGDDVRVALLDPGVDPALGDGA